MQKLVAASLALALTSIPVSSTAAAAHAGEAEFRALYRELVETNTSLSAGDCTLAAHTKAG